MKDISNKVGKNLFSQSETLYRRNEKRIYSWEGFNSACSRLKRTGEKK